MSASLNPAAQQCLQDLMTVWFEFERRLNKVPIIKRLEHGQFTQKDYLALLFNLRQQVIEGARWISRGASSFDRDYAEVRSMVIGHAREEHKDYLHLEQDYERAGGQINDIQQGKRNTGSDALHGFMMYRASLPNPIDLLGAMWIIEGLGHKMANNWAQRITELTGLSDAVNFMRYHGENDDAHMEKLYQMLDSVCRDEHDSARIAATAKVVARLYCLQLECIDE